MLQPANANTAHNINKHIMSAPLAPVTLPFVFLSSSLLLTFSLFCFSSLSRLPGDNILAVLKHLVMSEELGDSSQYRHGNMVFFDLLGVVVVAYPARVGTILNYVVAAATVFYLAKKAARPGNGGTPNCFSSLFCFSLFLFFRSFFLFHLIYSVSL